MRPVLRIIFLLLVLAPLPSFGQHWHKNLDDAIAEAGSRRLNILLLFSVPTACDVCADLEKKVMMTPEFRAYAAAHFVLVKPDFSGAAPYEEKADNLLIVEKYDKDGFFPWVVILDASGRIVGKTGAYDGENPDEYISKLNKILAGR